MLTNICKSITFFFFTVHLDRAAFKTLVKLLSSTILIRLQPITIHVVNKFTALQSLRSNTRQVSGPEASTNTFQTLTWYFELQGL